MRSILIVCSLPDEKKDSRWYEPGNLIAVREAFADVMRFAQSNGIPVWIPNQLFCTELATSLCIKYQTYKNAERTIAENICTIVFIGGADFELALFQRLRSMDRFLLPIPFSTGAARVMYEEVRAQFSEEQQAAIANAQYAVHMLSHFLQR